MSEFPDPFPSRSPIAPSPIRDIRQDLYSYWLIRSLQRNWTSDQLRHRSFYRPLITLDGGYTSPPLLAAGDHYFKWCSSFHHQPLVTVCFSVQPYFQFPSPHTVITHSLTHTCPSIIIVWWDIPTEPPFSALQFLYELDPLLQEDLTPFAQVLSQFCLEYYTPVSPY